MKNSLVYFTYNTNSPLQDTDEILDMTVVFPNMSYSAGESGAMTFGDKMSLGTFNSGTSIGFALIYKRLAKPDANGGGCISYGIF